jgi:hypothetical protein
MPRNQFRYQPRSCKPQTLVSCFLTLGVLLLSSAAFGGTFKAAGNYVVGEHPTAIAAGDFRGNGKTDLAVANGGKTVSVLLGNGDGTFGKAAQYKLGVVPGQIVVADFNGDGRADILVQDVSGARISVLVGKGDGSFEPHLEVSSGQVSAELLSQLRPATASRSGFQTASAVFADFNGDGQMDEAVAMNGRNTVSVLLGGAEVPGTGSGTNILQNSGFETGTLAPWMIGNNFCGSPCAPWADLLYHPIQGAWDAGDEGNIEIVQSFAATPSSSINSIGLWMLHPNYPATTAIDFIYSDGTDDEFVVVPSNQNWDFFIVTSDLAAGKSLQEIGIWGYSGGIGSPVTFLDGVEILVNN